MPAVLVVTSDPGAEELIGRSLTNLGYEVVTTASGEAAIRSLFTVKVDAAVVDAALGEDVEWLCQRIRGFDGSIPMVFLAPPGTQWLPGSLPVMEGLDEVVVKPCSSKDVRQAVERVLTASHRSRPHVVLVGDLQVDRTTHEVRGEGGSVIQLTPTEFRLMEYLAQRQGAIASAEELLEKVWEFFPGTGSSELVRSHIRNLRAKLRLAVPGRELIQTVPRRGYRLA